MPFILQVSHPLGADAVKREHYWYGFIVHHLAVGKDGSIQSKVSALEVAQLSLSIDEDHRQNGGFQWPVIHFNALREKLDPSLNQIGQSLYVALDVPDVAFADFKNRTRVDLLLARKGDQKLFDYGMVAKVSAFRDQTEEPWLIGEDHIDDAAVYRTLFKAERPAAPLEPVLDSAWVGVNSFDGGIEKFLLEQETAAKDAVTAKEESERKARQASKTPSPYVSTIQAPPDSTASAAKAVARHAAVAETIAPAPVIEAAAPAQEKSKANGRGLVPYAVAAAVLVAGAITFLQQKRTDSDQAVLSPSSSPVVVATPALPKAVPVAPSPIPRPAPAPPPPPSSPSASVPAPQPYVAPAPPPVAQASPDPIFVPQGNSVVARDKLYSLGFEPQLVLVKRMLTATKQQNATEFDSVYEELKGFRQQHEWSKSDAVARRKFNERMETLVNTAKSANDQAGLQSAISLSEQFLMSHFGHSTAHLNLSIAQAAAGNAKSALAPAFHTIVFNPEGANGWVALGVALARSGDETGATSAFCAALRKVNYSDRTVNYFDKVIRGEDLPYPEVTKAMSAIHTTCPKASWARQTNTP